MGGCYKRNYYRYIPGYFNFYYCLIYLKPFKLLLFSYIILLFRATRRNPKLRVVITHARVCSYARIPRPVSTGVENVACIRLDFHVNNEWKAHNAIWSRTFEPSIWLVIWSRVFWLSVTWNLRQAQRWSKSVLTFDRCRPHYLTFGYY